MGEENVDDVVLICNGILFSLEKGDPTIGNNIDEYRGHNVK